MQWHAYYAPRGVEPLAKFWYYAHAAYNHHHLQADNLNDAKIQFIIFIE